MRYTLMLGWLSLLLACEGTAPASRPLEMDASVPSNADAATDGGSGDSGLDEVLDGGGLAPEDDPDAGSGFDLDAGVPRSGDGGTPACLKVTAGARLSSTCVSLAAPLAGGTLPSAAEYQLTGVKVVGTRTFCANDFVVFEHFGGLRLKSENGQPIFEFYDVYGRASAPTRTIRRWNAKGAVNGSQLTFFPVTPLCEVGGVPATAQYSVYTMGRTGMLDVRLPYGSGVAIYTFQRQ